MRAAATSNDGSIARGPLATLTYISIGFCANLIYTDAGFGVDHNMLLTDPKWASRERQSASWSQRLRAFATTFALSPQTVAIIGPYESVWRDCGAGVSENRMRHRKTGAEVRLRDERWSIGVTRVYQDLQRITQFRRTVGRCSRFMVVTREARG
jgi:hypothetical protein